MVLEYQPGALVEGAAGECSADIHGQAGAGLPSMVRIPSRWCPRTGTGSRGTGSRGTG